MFQKKELLYDNLFEMKVEGCELCEKESDFWSEVISPYRTATGESISIRGQELGVGVEL